MRSVIRSAHLCCARRSITPTTACTPISDWMLGQLVTVAGDVDAADFVAGNKDTESMLAHAYRLTNYFNRYDEVLAISRAKNGGVAERAGRVGLPPNAPASTVNLDCSQRFSEIPDPGGLDPIARAEFSHSGIFRTRNSMPISQRRSAARSIAPSSPVEARATARR